MNKLTNCVVNKFGNKRQVENIHAGFKHGNTARLDVRKAHESESDGF
jgi:hypothetical protein